jgi:hypothetical protein
MTGRDDNGSFYPLNSLRAARKRRRPAYVTTIVPVITGWTVQW